MADQECIAPAKGRPARHGHAAGGTSTKTYDAWCSMKKRCISPSHASFKDYGGRGIEVCKRWLVFENFLSDMGEAPIGMSLDRYPDNDGRYEPGNCRWATMTDQNNNRRSNTILEFNGKIANISKWSEITGIKDCTISERLLHGWSIEKTLSTKTRIYRRKVA